MAPWFTYQEIGDTQYGPYVTLPAGSYRVTWDGAYINEISTDVNMYGGSGTLTYHSPCQQLSTGQPYEDFTTTGGGLFEFRAFGIGDRSGRIVSWVTLSQTE